MRTSKRWSFIVLGIVVMMFLGTVYSYSVFRVALETEFNIGAAESGLPYMVALASYALFMLITGKHIVKFHPSKVLLLGGMLVALGWILSSFATNIFMLTITYGLISGAGVGIAYGVPMAVVAKWFPDKKGLAVGMVLIGFGLSPLITAPIARTLVEAHGVMQSFLMLGIGFGVILPLLAFGFKYPSDENIYAYKHSNKGTQYSEEIPLKEMVNTKGFKGIYLNFVIGTMIGLMMIGLTTRVGLDYFGLGATTVTQFMALFAVFNGLGRPLLGWITDRYTSRNAMLCLYALIIAASVSLILLNNHMIVYMITFSVYWFSLGGWLAIAPTTTLKLFGMKHYSENYGLVFTAYGIGALIGVSTSGFLLDHQGNYHHIFIYVLILCALGVLLTRKYMK